MIKIAIFHPWSNTTAEREVAIRYSIAASNLDGVKILEVSNSDEINEFNPDFVLSLASQSSKVTSHPTYFVDNAPLEIAEMHMDQEREKKSVYIYGLNTHQRRAMTFDGYLTISDIVSDYYKNVCFGYNKKLLIENGFANTFPETQYEEVSLSHPKIAYFGTNWDSGEVKDKSYRFSDIFSCLMKNSDDIRFYGKKDSWSFLDGKFFGGSVPFDGTSLLQYYRMCGVGLNLTKKEWFDSDVPTNRVFEIVASGAICISDRLPILEKIFGDSILYVDVKGKTPKKIADQILYNLHWINKNPEKAKEKAKKANKIFNETLSMEVMLKKLIAFHKKALIEQHHNDSFSFKKQSPKKPLVSMILRTGGRDPKTVERAVLSIANQSYDNIELIVSLYKENEQIVKLLKKHEKLFAKFKIIEAFENIGVRSTPMWEGMQNISGEYFGFLDDDDEIFPNHISTILRQFENASLTPNVGLVYSGSLSYNKDSYYSEEDRLKEDEKTSRVDAIIYGQHENARMDKFGFLNDYLFLNDSYNLQPNSWLAKSELLDDKILEDPILKTAEDYYITLLLYQKCNFVFSCELTSLYSVYEGDNSASITDQNELFTSRKKIFERLRFHNKRYFPLRCHVPNYYKPHSKAPSNKLSNNFNKKEDLKKIKKLLFKKNAHLRIFWPIIKKAFKESKMNYEDMKAYNRITKSTFFKKKSKHSYLWPLIKIILKKRK